ncbi:MAG: hypothetical protein KAI72_03525, partial [Candidatus Pacebacteria bacterium]|nr:hypothetical protein [Candidatus Paceibacterota bacterium]
LIGKKTSSLKLLGERKLKELKKLAIGSLSTSAVLGFIIVLLVVFVGILGTGVTAIFSVIPWKIGIIVLLVLGLIINLLSGKENENKKIMFLKEALIIKKTAESILGGKCKAVYIEWNDNIEVLGYTSKKTVQGTENLAVYCPSTPMTATGFIYFVKEDKIKDAGLTNLEAGIILASGGL